MIRHKVQLHDHVTNWAINIYLLFFVSPPPKKNKLMDGELQSLLLLARCHIPKRQKMTDTTAHDRHYVLLSGSIPSVQLLINNLQVKSSRSEQQKKKERENQINNHGVR